MNIFMLSEMPRISAQMHCDRHVVKMILETAQLLSTAHHELDGDRVRTDALYKSTHKNHPSNIWVRENIANYKWTYQLFVELCREYTFRYGKIHATDAKLRYILSHPPANIKWADTISFAPKCMPDEYKNDDDGLIPWKSYRAYYLGDKAAIAKWTKREIPYWWSREFGDNSAGKMDEVLQPV